MMAEGQPYLSVVVTARNDDHGGNLLRRVQIFVAGWIAQVRRYGVRSEMIIVEWNPPAGTPKLREALRWPEDFGPCEVRFIEVPPEIHRRYRHAEALPLYQMIAKNVGIRRARGRFILATNIDILFSNELMEFFARELLQPGHMYRIDRYDVMSDVPVDGTIDEQLEYCQRHRLRINVREGTFPLTPDGRRTVAKEDIAIPESGITFGRGWYAVERYSEGELFRWAENDAEIDIDMDVSPHDSAALRLDIEPGPGMGGRLMKIQVFDRDRLLATAAIMQRSTVRVPVSGSGNRQRRLSIRVFGGGAHVRHDPRLLNFRVFSCAWEPARAQGRSLAAKLTVLPVNLWHGAATFWKRLQLLVRRLSQSGPSLTIAVPVSPMARRAAAFYVEWGGLTGMLVNAVVYLRRKYQFEMKAGPGADVFDIPAGIRPGCGWHPLEDYRLERFRWVRNRAEIILLPAAQNSSTLLLQVEPGPGVGYRAFELLVRNEDGEIVGRCSVRRLDLVTIPLTRKHGLTETFSLGLEGGDLVGPADPRILNFRVFWCTVDPPATAGEVPGVAGAQPESPAQAEVPTAPEVSPAIAFLHTNACGDFTLAARERWFDLRAYPEFDLFSMNIDSVFCYAAHHGGALEAVLPDPMRIYHIEHGAGSGWTPEGQAQLFARIAAQGISFVSWEDVAAWAAQMRRLDSPMIFNHEKWGLADVTLTETSPKAAPQSTLPPQNVMRGASRSE